MLKWLRRCHGSSAAALSSGRRCTQRRVTGSGVSASGDGIFDKSISDHYSSPGRLAEYKHQLQRAFRRPGDDPSIFAIELETLARRL